MWDAGVVDDVTWGVLTVTLTLLGGVWTWFAYQRRGLAAGLKGAAFTLVPLAAYLTETLQMFTRVVGAVADWATSLVFSPVVWLGVVLAGLSVLLFGASRAVATRSGSAPARTATSKRSKKQPTEKTEALGAAPAPRGGAPVIDDDLADIEAILRKRGIS